MKYRVWCKNKKQYESDQCFLMPDGRLFQEGGYNCMHPLSEDTHIIEQCLDIKDDDGYFIYVGDHVRCWGGEYHEGMWERNEKIIVTNANVYEFYLGEFEHKEIIGNAHDLPKESE